MWRSSGVQGFRRSGVQAPRSRSHLTVALTRALARLPGGSIRSGACALVGGLLLAGHATAAGAPLVNIHSIDPTIQVDLHYNSPKNVFHRRLYRSNAALLRKPVAQRLSRVQKHLRAQGFGLKIWDAYRPTSVQATMWRLKPGTRYLANPRKGGSKHSRGAAVDLTLVDSHGREVPMPTPHDEFSPRAHRGALRGVSAQARKDLRILDSAMRMQGFMGNPYEWWHYTARDWARYAPADAPLPQAPRAVH